MILEYSDDDGNSYITIDDIEVDNLPLDKIKDAVHKLIDEDPTRIRLYWILAELMSSLGEPSEYWEGIARTYKLIINE